MNCDKDVVFKKKIERWRKTSSVIYPFAKDQEGSQEWKLMKESRRLKVSDKDKVSYVGLFSDRSKKSLWEVLNSSQLKRQETQRWFKLLQKRCQMPDAREATQVAQTPRNQVQRAQAQKVVVQNGLQVIQIKKIRRSQVPRKLWMVMPKTQRSQRQEKESSVKLKKRKAGQTWL